MVLFCKKMIQLFIHKKIFTVNSVALLFESDTVHSWCHAKKSCFLALKSGLKDYIYFNLHSVMDLYYNKLRVDYNSLYVNLHVGAVLEKHQPRSCLETSTQWLQPLLSYGDYCHIFYNLAVVPFTLLLWRFIYVHFMHIIVICITPFIVWL